MKATLDADDRFMLLVDECPSGRSSRAVVDVPPQLVRRYSRLIDRLDDVEAAIARHIVDTRQLDGLAIDQGIANLVRVRAEAAP